MEYNKNTLPPDSPLLNRKVADTLIWLMSKLPYHVSKDLESALISPDITLSTLSTQSKSYVVIVCSPSANPDYNVIELRMSNKSINLRPGINILTIEEYPELKYGFKPRIHRRGMLPNENCQAVMEVDLSHFDASEVESTEGMFDDMFALRRVNLSNVKFNNVRTMDNMFARCYSLKEIVVNNIHTFSSDVLVSANGMFYSTSSIRSLGMGYFGGTNLNETIGMFASMEALEELDLSGWNLRGITFGTSDEPLFHGCEKLKKIYLFGCSDYTVEKIRKQLMNSADVPNDVKLRRIFLAGAK